MKTPFAAALLAALPLLAGADGVADPAAPVPRVAYRSVFQDLPAGIEEQAVDWQKANAEVGQFTRGHVDILRWEQRQAARPRAPASAPTAHRHEGH